MILEAFVNSAALKANRRLFVAHEASTSTHATVFSFFPLTQRLISILSVERVLTAMWCGQLA